MTNSNLSNLFPFSNSTFCCYIAGLSIQDKTEESSIEEKKDSQNRVEVEGGDQSKILKLFSFLQTLTATFASFVHGGNDVRYEVLGCRTQSVH
jgi:phosphate/sulfate permease